MMTRVFVVLQGDVVVVIRCVEVPFVERMHLSEVVYGPPVVSSKLDMPLPGTGKEIFAFYQVMGGRGTADDVL